MTILRYDASGLFLLPAPLEQRKRATSRSAAESWLLAVEQSNDETVEFPLVTDTCTVSFGHGASTYPSLARAYIRAIYTNYIATEYISGRFRRNITTAVEHGRIQSPTEFLGKEGEYIERRHDSEHEQWPHQPQDG